MPVEKTRNIKHGCIAQHAQSITVIIPNITAFHEIASGFTSGGGLGFVFQNSKELKCEEPGDYLVNWNISLVLSQTNNQNFIGGVMINQSIQVLTTAHGKIGAANDLVNISGVGVLTLVLNDLVSLGLRNLDASEDFVVQHAALTLAKLID